MILAVANHDAIADGADAQARQRHLFRQVTTQIFERAIDATTGDLRFEQRTSGAQHDEILERKHQLALRAARGLHEAGFDQPTDGAARQAQDPF